MQSRIAVMSVVVLGVMLFSIGTQAEESAAAAPFKVSLTLRGEYTDNRDSLPDSMAEDTFDFYIKPRLDWLADWERAYLNMFYAPSWRYRTDESAIQNNEEWRQEFGLHTEYSASPGTVLRLDEKFDYTDDPSVTDESGIARRDASYILNRAEVGVTRAFSEGWTGDLAARHSTKQYDDSDVAATSDEDRLDGEGIMTYQINPSLGTDLRVMYSDYTFDDSNGYDRDFASLLVAVGLQAVVNPQLSGGLSLGVQSQDYQDSTIDSDETPFAQLWVAVNTIPATRMRASAEHGLRDSDVYPFASQEYTDLKASVAWDVLPRLTLSVLGLYRNSDYADVAPNASGVESGEVDKYIAQGEVEYRFNRRNKISLSQTYEDVDASNDIPAQYAWDYTKNTTRIMYGRAF